jgi:hypothetical protein
MNNIDRTVKVQDGYLSFAQMYFNYLKAALESVSAESWTDLWKSLKAHVRRGIRYLSRETADLHDSSDYGK